jgi:hypothetical protein
MVASMREYDGSHTIPRGEQYQQPLKNKISEPSEFMDRQSIKPHQMDHVRRQTSIRLNQWKANSEQDFKALQVKFDKPKKPPDPEEK